MENKQTNTLIVGASIAGLACAACLQQSKIPYIIIESTAEIATPWRNHYERLHLHTSRRFSNLPHKKFDRNIPRYPSRLQVLDYLEAYRKTFDIHPVFNTTALSITRTPPLAASADPHWITTTSNGTIQSTNLIMATGAFGKAKPVELPGMDSFPGSIIHSQDYKTGRDFKGKKVLVIGFGNSACEIAIDLYESGAQPCMSVRSPVNIIPRDIFGIPVLEISLLMSNLPPKIADKLSAPLANLLIGDLSKTGLQRPPYGPLEQISKEAKAPVLDIGTIKHIRQGHIRVKGGIDHIEGRNVHFKSPAQTEDFDAIIAAIGYYRDYADFLHVDPARFEDLTSPTDKQQFFGKDNLYFCGYYISPTGHIREIANDAKRIAGHIALAQEWHK